MIFLIVYSRTTREIETLSYFFEDKIALAQSERFKAELSASRDSGVEAVLLRAESEAEVRKTHSRYFEPAGSLLDAVRESMAAS